MATKTSKADDVRRNDLNSVLLEGKIESVTAIQDNPDAPTLITMRSARLDRSRRGAIHYTTIQAEVPPMDAMRKTYLEPGRQIRVVGRLLGTYRRSIRLALEHIEFKPVSSPGV